MDATTGRRSFPIEIAIVWTLLLAVAIALLVTYWRLDPGELYHTSGSGFDAGLSRVLVFLNFPTALVALALLALLADRLGGREIAWLAGAGAALCAVVFLPGVVDQADLDAKWVNGFCAVGVAVAAALTIVAARRFPLGRLERMRADPLRLALAAAAFVLSVPWLAADVGVSFDGVPVLGTIYQTGELRTQPGDPVFHPAVHLGHHHGLDGFLLILAALLLSRLLPRVRRGWVRAVTGFYLALMLVYGIGEIANDFWLEQVVKRGWTNWEIADITRPTLSVAWGIVILATIAIFVLGARNARRGAPAAGAVAPVSGV